MLHPIRIQHSLPHRWWMIQPAQHVRTISSTLLSAIAIAVAIAVDSIMVQKYSVVVAQSASQRAHHCGIRSSTDRRVQDGREDDSRVREKTMSTLCRI